MTSKETTQLIKGLRKLKKEHIPKVGSRSTITECVDFLLACLGEKV